MAGEVTDPRVRAILLGGGAATAASPFAISAAQNALKKRAKAQQRANIGADRKARIAAKDAAFANRGKPPLAAPRGLSALGRLAGPAGAAAGILMPSGNMAGPEATMLRPNETYSDPVLQRGMFGGQPPQAAGTGITSGLETTPEQEAEMEGTLAEIAGGLQSMNDDIDNAEDYVGIMNAIRGDDQSIDQRRNELAGYIGKEDAGKTPESALTLIQPSLTLLDSAEQGSQEEGGAIADDGIMSMLGELGGQGAMQGAADAMQGGQPMQAPGQDEAIMRMAMGEQPVMRQSGSSAEGETTFPSGMNLATLKTLQGLVPQATTYDQNLKYYKDVLGSDKTGYELNPYIAGLNLAAAVANAPEGGLLTSVLAPETIKAVSDPILQMAQAKSKTEQAVKLKAAEATAASKTAKAKAESDLLLKVAPDLLKIPDLKTFGDATFGYYAVDPKNPTVPITLKEGLGRKKTPFGDSKMGYHVLNEDGKTTTQVAEGTGAPPPKIFGDSEFGYFYLDDKDAVQTAKAGSGKANQIFGNATTGYFAFDPSTKSATKIEGAEGTGIQPPEFIALMDRYNSASAIVNNEQSTAADIAKAKNEMGFLSDKLTTKDPEFTNLMNTKAQMIFANTEGTDLEKAAARDLYIGKTIDAFIKGKNTVTTQYNPNEALDKEFAGLLGKQIKDIGEGAQSADKLSSLADISVLASNKFSTGAFAETRLSVIKMVDEVGGRDKLRSLIGEEQFNKLFSGETGNDVASGELLKSVGAQFAVMMAESFPGNLNQSEVQLIIDAGPNIGVSPDGLKTLQKVFAAAKTRARVEADYSSEFLLKEENQGIGAEQKYAKFNQGLKDIRAANPVITQEMVSQLQASVDAPPAGSLAVINDQGQADFVPADEIAAFNAVKNSADRNSFIANWPNLLVTNPELNGMDPATTYDTFVSVTESN